MPAAPEPGPAQLRSADEKEIVFKCAAALCTRVVGHPVCFEPERPICAVTVVEQGIVKAIACLIDHRTLAALQKLG